MRRYLVSLVPTAAMLTVVIGACGSGGTSLSQTTALLPTIQPNGNQWNTIPTVPSTLSSTAVPGGAADPGLAGTGIPDYTVVQGDYPLKIMKNYDGCTWEEVSAFNERKPDALFPGDVITFPPTCVLKGDPAAAPVDSSGAATADTATTTAAPATTGADGTFPYKVVANDTVYGIAKKFDVKIAALIAANGWPTDPTQVKLYPDREIKIPGKAPA